MCGRRSSRISTGEKVDRYPGPEPGGDDSAGSTTERHESFGIVHRLAPDLHPGVSAHPITMPSDTETQHRILVADQVTKDQGLPQTRPRSQRPDPHQSVDAPSGHHHRRAQIGLGCRPLCADRRIEEGTRPSRTPRSEFRPRLECHSQRARQPGQSHPTDGRFHEQQHHHTTQNGRAFSCAESSETPQPCG